MGKVRDAVPEKLPTPSAVKVALLPPLSVTVTTAPAASGLLQSLYSCPDV